MDEEALGIAIKGDLGNEINNMITGIYRANSEKKKSNLKASSLSDERMPDIALDDSSKKVSFGSVTDSNGKQHVTFSQATQPTDLKKRKFSALGAHDQAWSSSRSAGDNLNAEMNGSADGKSRSIDNNKSTGSLGVKKRMQSSKF